MARLGRPCKSAKLALGLSLIGFILKLAELLFGPLQQGPCLSISLLSVGLQAQGYLNILLTKLIPAVRCEDLDVASPKDSLDNQLAEDSIMVEGIKGGASQVRGW